MNDYFSKGRFKAQNYGFCLKMTQISTCVLKPSKIRHFMNYDAIFSISVPRMFVKVHCMFQLWTFLEFIKAMKRTQQVWANILSGFELSWKDENERSNILLYNRKIHEFTKFIFIDMW